jgi:hypothetical protein
MLYPSSGRWWIVAASRVREQRCLTMGVRHIPFTRFEYMLGTRIGTRDETIVFARTGNSFTRAPLMISYREQIEKRRAMLATTNTLRADTFS